MASVNYITPITNRTRMDVEYARQHQDDLTNKNIGAWNYTDMNRICNNLKYAADYMYEQGFLSKPYSAQIKLDWKETDIITYETLNTMIVNNINNLKTYSRTDLPWFSITSIVNIDYSLANWIERNIHALATQEPIPPDTYTLTVVNGLGSGDYKANEIITVQANPPEAGLIFDHWSGDHLEKLSSATSAIATYQMPHQNITLQANYTSTIPHKLTIKTHTKTETVQLAMGSNHFIEADPAPHGKVFHHWIVEPKQYEDNLYEPAATTYFTMPNEEVSLTAVYISKGKKQLKVVSGEGSGYYDYDEHVIIKSSKPENATFTNWSGDTQYLTSSVETEFNTVKIPDKNVITVYANWTTPPVPPLTNIKLTVENGIISSTGKTEGLFTQGEEVQIETIEIPEGQKFEEWTKQGGGSLSSYFSPKTIIAIGSSDTVVKAYIRPLEYHDLTVTTHSGTITETKESFDYFKVNANPAPDGQTFDKWTGDTLSFEPRSI